MKLYYDHESQLFALLENFIYWSDIIMPTKKLSSAKRSTKKYNLTKCLTSIVNYQQSTIIAHNIGSNRPPSSIILTEPFLYQELHQNTFAG